MAVARTLAATSLLALLALPTFAGEAELKAELGRCAALGDTTARLACYDALARTSGAAAGPASAAGAPAGTGAAGTPAASPAPAAGGTAAGRVPASDRLRAPSTSQCQAKLANGAQCPRRVKAGSTYCWQHGG